MLALFGFSSWLMVSRLLSPGVWGGRHAHDPARDVDEDVDVVEEVADARVVVPVGELWSGGSCLLAQEVSLEQWLRVTFRECLRRVPPPRGLFLAPPLPLGDPLGQRRAVHVLPEPDARHSGIEGRTQIVK